MLTTQHLLRPKSFLCLRLVTNTHNRTHCIAPNQAWAGVGDAVEANALSNFVAQTLARAAVEEAEAAATGAAADVVVESDALAARIK